MEICGFGRLRTQGCWDVGALALPRHPQWSQKKQHFINLGRSGPIESPIRTPQACSCLIGFHPLLKTGSDPEGLSEQPCRLFLPHQTAVLPESCNLLLTPFFQILLCFHSFHGSCLISALALSSCLAPAACLILALSLAPAPTLQSCPLSSNPASSSGYQLQLDSQPLLPPLPIGQTAYTLVPNTSYLCACTKFPCTKLLSTLVPLETLSRLCATVTRYFIVELSESNGYMPALMVMDQLIKMVHFVPCDHLLSAKKAAQLLMIQVICLHGLPDSVGSD